MNHSESCLCELQIVEKMSDWVSGAGIENCKNVHAINFYANAVTSEIFILDLNLGQNKSKLALDAQ